MQYLLHLLDTSTVVKLVAEHLFVLLPASKKLFHLVLVCLVEVKPELLLYVEIAEGSEFLWYLTHLKLHKIAVKG